LCPVGYCPRCVFIAASTIASIQIWLGANESAPKIWQRRRIEASPAPLVVLRRCCFPDGLSGSTIQRIALPATTDHIGNSSSLKSQNANCFASHASAILQHGCDKTTRRANHLKPCPALFRKIFRLTWRPNHRLIWSVSPDERGLAIVTNARWDAMDAKAATDERGSSGRQSRVVLTPRWQVSSS
jgi:hypothetical protein